MIKFFGVFIFSATLVMSAYARKLKNPYHAATQRQAAESSSSFTGRWTLPVQNALNNLIAREGKTSAHYDPTHPPIVVIPWRDAAVAGDLSAAIFFHMVEHIDFKFSDDFWEFVPIAYGRHRARVAYEQFQSWPRVVWTAQPAYAQYRKALLEGYSDMCDKLGRRECRSMLTRLMIGFTPQELATYAAKVYKAESAHPIGSDIIVDAPDDRSPVKFRRGMAEIAEMREFCRVFNAAGFEIWVIDMEAQVPLKMAVERYGINPAHVVGLQATLNTARFTGVLRQPIPIRGGKTEAIIAKTGRAPRLVVGSTEDDIALMSYGRGLRIVLDRGDARLKAAAKKNGWFIQPGFAP